MNKLCLAFDTETTGKVNKYNLPGTSDQPDLVQLAAILFDQHEVHSMFSCYVIPEKAIESGAQEVHGISYEKCDKLGVSRRTAAAIFLNYARKADVLVGHNLDFDLRVIQTAFIRESVSWKELSTKEKYCTMQESTDICKIPSQFKPGEYKWPKLIEAYKVLVDPEGFEGAHDALVDVKACVEIYRKLVFAEG